MGPKSKEHNRFFQEQSQERKLINRRKFGKFHVKSRSLGGLITSEATFPEIIFELGKGEEMLIKITRLDSCKLGRVPVKWRSHVE
jgi:hypothetical protein